MSSVCSSNLINYERVDALNFLYFIFLFLLILYKART